MSDFLCNDNAIEHTVLRRAQKGAASIRKGFGVKSANNRDDFSAAGSAYSGAGFKRAPLRRQSTGCCVLWLFASPTIWNSSAGEVFSFSSLRCSDVRVRLMDRRQHVVFIVYTVSLRLSLSIVCLTALLVFFWGGGGFSTIWLVKPL